MLLVLPIKWNFFHFLLSHKNKFVHLFTHKTFSAVIISLENLILSWVEGKMWKVLHALFLLPPPSATFQTINFSSFCKFSSLAISFRYNFIDCEKVFFLLFLWLWHCCAEWNTLFTSWYDWYMFHVVKG